MELNQARDDDCCNYDYHKAYIVAELTWVTKFGHKLKHQDSEARLESTGRDH